MSQMATTPVYACRKCGKPVYVTHLSSINDPDSKKLMEMMQVLGKIVLCPPCRRAYNWYAQQGREDEFLLNPHLVIYNVVDKSGINYYNDRKASSEG